MTLREIAIIQDKKIGNPKKIKKSPSSPDSPPIRNPTRGKAQAAFVKFGALSEKRPIYWYSCKKHNCCKKI